ncbi:MAG: DUF11 domain-containing protein, partial [Anaerolineae bacterium]|nr:DUF11 domain-containing protein [Anaerolineae bacterium]
ALQPGASTTVDIVLTVNGGLSSGAQLINVAEITSSEDGSGNDMTGLDIDSTPDDNESNDAGGAVNSGSDDVTGGNGTGIPGGTDPSTDEDDQDPEDVVVNPFDLAMIKELGSGQSAMVGPGDDVTFTITVYNQGLIPADNIEITDYVPSGFTFNAGLNPAWSAVASGASTTLEVSAGELPAGGLAPGASTTVDIILTVNGGLSSGTQLVNVAEISDATDEMGLPVDDVDSTPDDTPGNDAGGNVNSASDDVNDGDGTGTPGDSDPVSDEDDSDPEDVIINPFDLALIKELAAGQSAMVGPGDDVRFTITVTNQGLIPANEIVITDYVPSGMTFNAANAVNTANGWLPYAGTDAQTTISLGTALQPGASTTVDIVLAVNGGLSSGAQLINVAEITSSEDGNGNDMTGLDVDSTPDDNAGNDAGGAVNSGSDDVIGGDGTGTPGGTDPSTDEDDQDPEDVVVNPFDLALIKELGAGQTSMVGPGDNVTFTITVYNQGLIPADNIEITDYIPSGFTFNAGLNPAWSAVASGASTTLEVSAGELPAGGLAPGASTTVDIILTVNGG